MIGTLTHCTVNNNLILIDTFFFRENGFQESVSTFGTVAGFWSSAYSLGYLQKLLLL